MWFYTVMTQIFQQAQILPYLNDKLKPGEILPNDILYQVLNATPKAEYFDVHEKGQAYSQRVNWADYAKSSQMYSSEKEWIVASLLNHNENSLTLDTLKDVFQIKSSNSSFKTKAGRLQFLSQVREQLKKIPYNSMELQRINAFIKEQSKALDYNESDITVNSQYVSTMCMRSFLYIHANDRSNCIFSCVSSSMNQNFTNS